MKLEVVENRLRKGIQDGVPIGLGYLSVSFTFGMMAVSNGIPVEAAVVISLTNVTSAGQFSGLTLMLAHGSYVELALSQFIINLRYALMSLSLTQKVDRHMKTHESPMRFLLLPAVRMSVSGNGIWQDLSPFRFSAGHWVPFWGERRVRCFRKQSGLPLVSPFMECSLPLSYLRPESCAPCVSYCFYL